MDNSGSSSNIVNKNGKGTKTKQKIKSKSAKKQVKKIEIVSVADNTIVKNEHQEEDTWESKVPEDLDEQLEKHKATVMIQSLKKMSVKNENVQLPSSSNTKVVPCDDFDKDMKNSDVEFQKFIKLLDSRDNISYTKVTEIDEDLFRMSKHYSLAHCVAEDLNMSSGIAVKFSSQFKRQGDLSNQRQKKGGLAILSFPPRFIYYLVTKKHSTDKPTFYTLWSSLTKMQRHVQENNVKLMALPRIGCGLDKLKWSVVKFMIEYIFKNTDVKITVCNFLQTNKNNVPVRKVIRKCKVVNTSHSVLEIEADTMIVYFGTEDGFVDSAIKKLDEKFHILPDYKRGPRALGKVIRTDVLNGSYVLFGFIVKESTKDVIDYSLVQKCAQEVNRYNRTFGEEAYQFLALDVFKDPSNDEMQFHKVLNILRCTLTYIDVYVCFPEDLKHMMPKKIVCNISNEHNNLLK